MISWSSRQGIGYLVLLSLQNATPIVIVERSFIGLPFMFHHINYSSSWSGVPIPVLVNSLCFGNGSAGLGNQMDYVALQRQYRNLHPPMLPLKVGQLSLLTFTLPATASRHEYTLFFPRTVICCTGGTVAVQYTLHGLLFKSQLKQALEATSFSLSFQCQHH
jgi:hypothetical protein